MKTNTQTNQTKQSQQMIPPNKALFIFYLDPSQTEQENYKLKQLLKISSPSHFLTVQLKLKKPFINKATQQEKN